MLYKTIVLELLEQRPRMYETLRKKQLLLTTLDRLASHLKTSHETFKVQLSQARTGCDPSQIASAALEMALQELLLEALPNESPPDPITGKYKDGWQAVGEELKTLLTPAEYDSAKRTTFNAFYTSPTVIQAMHDALARLGVPAQALVLEPGAGTGNFMSLGREGMRFIGEELDSISGRIARALHPGQDIRIENVRDTKLPELDAVIGNISFADVKLEHRGQKFSLHDYFFAKSVDALRPGGVLALVTSHFTLDKQNAAIREYLADRADFLEAIRLPSDAFKTGRNSRCHGHRVSEKTGGRRTGPPCRSGMARHGTAFPRRRRDAGQPLLSEASGNGPWHREQKRHALRRRLQRDRPRRPGRATPGRDSSPAGSRCVASNTQAGLIHKPMYVVPNRLLEQFAREFMQVYPNAKILVAAKEDFTKDRRKYLTAKIATGAWDAIIVTHSSFERIGMSKEYQEEFLLEQIKEYDELLKEHASAKAKRARRNLIKTIEKQKAKRAEQLKDLLAEDKKDDGLVFGELGVDHLFIDEFQYFKNLEAPTKLDRVAGIPTGGSERAFDLYMKARYLDQQHPGHGLIGTTGTPISNSMVEMYTVQRFLDSAGLRQRGIEHLDAWAATFGEVVDTMEISPDGKTLKPRSRFAKFVNLPELQQMFRTFADVQTAEMLKLPRPPLETGKPIIVACPMSEEQDAIQQQLVERYDRLRTAKVDPREDNALAITTDGRKLALDARMLSPTAPDFPGSKVNALVDNVLAIWKRTAATRGTQMVFCDMGVHPTPWGYSAYDEIITKLVERGVPRAQIATIGDADTDAKKRTLFDKVRSGQVRVLLGSTQKMGTGTNVQKRLVALHHLDAPWKPAEVEQREGRILRQGNENEQVAIYRYVTQRSFDSYMWQTLEVKAKFINQIMQADNTGRHAEDIGGQELDYATVKSIASGNPAFMTLAEADAEIKRLTILEKNHADEQFIGRRRLRELPGMIDQLSERLANLTADQATLTAHADDPVVVGRRTAARENAIDILGPSLDSLPQHVSQTRRIALGTYCGLRFGIITHPAYVPEVFLEGAATRTAQLSRDH